MSNSLVNTKPLTKIILFSGEVIFSTDEFVKIATEIKRNQHVYASGVSKLITTSAVKLIEKASAIENFEYYDLNSLPIKIRGLMKDKIEQSREKGELDKVTPEMINSWVIAIQNHIRQFEEIKKDLSPEAIEDRKRKVEEMRTKLIDKMTKKD